MYKVIIISFIDACRCMNNNNYLYEFMHINIVNFGENLLSKNIGTPS